MTITLHLVSNVFAASKTIMHAPENEDGAYLSRQETLPLKEFYNVIGSVYYTLLV